MPASARRAPTPRGMSLYLAMVLVAIMALLTVAMTVLFTTNLQISQAFINGNRAMAEAEAGVQQLMANLSIDPKFGQRGEQIEATSTPGMTSDQAWHRITFDASSPWPWSANNTDANQATGYLGRAIPARHVLAFSTGYCGGQYRTIEVLLDQPPFPYAMAVSGQINSASPIYVEGTTSAQKYAATGSDRPGHIVANSAGGIQIAAGNPPTYISGTVRSAGPIQIQPPATVRGGIKPNCGPLALPEISIDSFSLKDQAGVRNLNSNPQASLDTFYYASSAITLSDHVTLNNAFIFADSDVVLSNGVEGVGAIVSKGSITLAGGISQVTGTNNIALVAEGPITISGSAAPGAPPRGGTPSPGGEGSAGSGNFFQGLVYSKSGITARNITVVGNLVVNAPAGQGNCTLDNVRLVANVDAARLAFAVYRSGSLGEVGDLFGMSVGSLNGADGNSDFRDGQITYDKDGNVVAKPAAGCESKGVVLCFGPPPGTDPQYKDGWQGEGRQALTQTLQQTNNNPLTAEKVLQSFPAGAIKIDKDAVIQRIPDLLKDSFGATLTNFSKAQDAAAAPGATAEDKARYQQAIKDLAGAMTDLANQNKSGGGGGAGMGTSGTVKDFTLNNFLPASDVIRIQCWKVYNQRL